MDDLIDPILKLIPAKYQHTVLLLALLWRPAVQVAHAIYTRGGIKGIWRALWLGQSPTPQQQNKP